MNITDYITSDYVLICSDIHGKWDIIPDFLKKYGITNAIIIQVGDFGIGYETPFKELKKILYLNDRLKTYDSKLIAIRGNHDDPKYFDGNHTYDNVHLMADYSVVNINGFNYLAIGGAVSIDRSNKKEWNRLMGIKWWLDKVNRKGMQTGWWEDEVIKYNPIVETITDIDIVISHSAPSFSTPYRKSNLEKWINRDKNLLSDIDTERIMLADIYQKLSVNNNIYKWYYGHFHLSNKEQYLNTTFQLLNINEIIEHK